jgi:hypothetical protein
MSKHRRSTALLALILFACTSGEPEPTAISSDPEGSSEIIRRGSCTFDVLSFDPDDDAAAEGPVLAPPYVVELTPNSPARIRFRGERWGRNGENPGRPFVTLINPDGQETFPGVGIYDGVLEVVIELDQVGVWRFSIVGEAVGCAVEIPIEVRAVGSG